MPRFAARLRATAAPWTRAFEELAAAYEATRFGPPAPDLGELHRLARRVRDELARSR
jgi:hypothetical protein